MKENPLLTNVAVAYKLPDGNAIIVNLDRPQATLECDAIQHEGHGELIGLYLFGSGQMRLIALESDPNHPNFELLRQAARQIWPGGEPKKN